MYTEIKTMLTPKVIKVDATNSNHAKVILEPLERGYGHTLGNAIRRILLSSMPGASIVEVSIDGVDHEYSTITGVHEDVISILLNLKNVALRMEDTQEATIKINKSTPGPVTVADIELPHDVEVTAYL